MKQLNKSTNQKVLIVKIGKIYVWVLSWSKIFFQVEVMVIFKVSVFVTYFICTYLGLRECFLSHPHMGLVQTSDLVYLIWVRLNWVVSNWVMFIWLELILVWVGLTNTVVWLIRADFTISSLISVNIWCFCLSFCYITSVSTISDTEVLGLTSKYPPGNDTVN